MQLYDLETEIFSFNLEVDKILEIANSTIPEYSEISKYQTVRRDLSFVISLDFTFEQVLKTIKQAEQNLITNIEVFDEYKGKSIPSGFRSISISIYFNGYTKTLTDIQVNKAIEKIISSLKNKFNIEMR